MSPRALEMVELEKWYKGKQYADRPDWFLARDVPLFERGPCIVYPISRIAISSHVDLVMGEGRFPKCGDPDTLKLARFETAMRHALTHAMHQRSACLLFGIRNDRPFADLIKSRWCEPELGADGEVLKLVIQYPYTKSVQRPDGEWESQAWAFRRVVDAQRDVTYQPAELREGLRLSDIDWVEDPTRTVEHGLGFCPAVWYPFERGCGVEGRIDGTAIHEDLLDEIYALDFALSLRHRAAVKVGEPQWVEIGVDAGYNPSEPGQLPVVRAVPKMGFQEGNPYADNPMQSGGDTYIFGNSEGRKKSPDVAWQYPTGAKVELISLGAEALASIDQHIRDLRMKLMESLAIVVLDPTDTKFGAGLSGRSLDLLGRRQHARCDQIRSDAEDNLIRPSLEMLGRITGVDQGDECVWGSYLDPTIEEIEIMSRTVRDDLAAGLVDRETAISKIAGWYGIE